MVFYSSENVKRNCKKRPESPFKQTLLNKTQNFSVILLVLEVQQRCVMSCLFWKIGAIRPSAVDDSEANKHQTCLHNSLCCIASWQRDRAGWEKRSGVLMSERRRCARQTAGLAGRRLCEWV